MKHIAIKGLKDGQVAYKLGGGETVLVQVAVADAPDGAHDLTLQGWQVDAKGKRYVDPDDNSAVIIPVKVRRVVIGKDGPSLDDEIADAQVAIVNRLRDHIEARGAIKKARKLHALAEKNDPDRGSI